MLHFSCITSPTKVPYSTAAPSDPANQPISGFDMEKVTTTLKQFVRDWSDEGRAERDACYKPITEEIQRLFPGSECSRGGVSILVPGAGLARLMFDIAKLESWDCVVTCYFIDTAHNVIAFIENIEKILKPGGYWINLGPLLYHFADMANEWSVELPYDEIRRIATDHFKFEILKEETSIPSGYIENQRSMLKLVYDSVFFVARKPL
ncbi:UPF0586 protein C9orf41-like [Stylophora pistillata]|uniref:carnosine N-methyltransferase n=1 Tax=Stylophora pistillata TaxID=50429 RepID=A0A2B4RDH3_STYPI|nr:UPF0586 protein C9orf41-like [Stylophora pistillata]